MTKKTRMIITIIVITAAALAIFRIFMIDVLIVSGRSMVPTLLPSQIVIVNKLYYGLMWPFGNQYIIRWHRPQPGDIVLFLNRYDNSTTVKRCIASEGDQIKINDGQLFINNRILPLKYYQEIKWKNYNEVPNGCIFVAGDNLSSSVDSREYGFIPNESTIGCAMFLH
jgi:signal peptidase I